MICCSIGCKEPGPESAFRAVVVGVIGLIASAALISFNAAFIARPATCILTPSCADNSVSNTTFSYGFQQSFFTVFNGWGPFKNYGQSQVKFLCQTIQIGVGALAFILYVIYLIIYYSCSNKAQQQIQPADSSRAQPRYPPTMPPPYNVPPPVPGQPGYYPPPSGVAGYYPASAMPPVYQPAPPPGVAGYYPAPTAPQSYQPPLPPPQAQPGYYPAPAPMPAQPAYRPPVYGQQPAPGAVSWNPYGRY